MERIGILGGTFDPPHVGHLWLAESAQDQLQLDQVLFLPAGKPPHKKEQPLSGKAHRFTMTELAVAGNDDFTVDDLDLTRPEPHYMSTLLPLVRQARPEVALWLLLGLDSLNQLPTWHEPRQIIRHCRLAVLPRPGAVLDWIRLSQAIPGVDAVVDFLDGPGIRISASEVRQCLSGGRSLRYLVPTTVLDYISREQLYCHRN